MKYCESVLCSKARYIALLIRNQDALDNQSEAKFVGVVALNLVCRFLLSWVSKEINANLDLLLVLQ